MSTGRIVGLVVLILVFASLAVAWRAEHEVASVVVREGEGRPRALVVVHHGIGSFQQEVTATFSDALKARGWRVDRTSPSREAPTALADYDLLVLGAPTYFWQAARPLTRYLERLGSLEGKAVALIMTGAGSGDGALVQTRAQVERQGGRVVTGLMLYVLRPNREDPASMARPNREVAKEIARTTAESLEAPPP